MRTAHHRLVLGPEIAAATLAPEEFDACEDCDELYEYELIG
jgi:hypothetical protein